MTQSPKLSNREWEVVKLLLQGKSNKLIALFLGISVRTVEFHLINIYAKFQVSSRVELILKLVNTTGDFDIEKLGHSAVDSHEENIENRDRLNSSMDWVTSFRDAVSIIDKELEMKAFLNSKHILAGMLTSLLAGIGWISVLLFSHRLSLSEIKPWIAPLIIIWVIIGLAIGFIGKRNDVTLRKIIPSTLFGTGLSPLTIIPLMMLVVLPVGKLTERIGLIDPSTIASGVAIMWTAAIMIVLWLMVAIIIGTVLLFVTFKKSKRGDIQSA